MEANEDYQAGGQRKRKNNQSLESRIEREVVSGRKDRSDGHQMTFYQKKTKKQKENEFKQKKHREERRNVRRSVSSLRNRTKKYT